MPDFSTTGDARTAYEMQGRGPALLLMHGAEASRQMFAAIVPLLAAHFTVIAYDQRDCGDTESPPRAATLAELAGDAHALIRALGLQRAHVFGSSYGGRVAQAVALLYPETVERLVLGSTWPLPQALAALNPQGVEAIQALRSRLPESAGELAALFFPEPFLIQRPELRGFFANVRPATERSQRRSIAVDSTIAAEPAAIAARTLLLAGDLDRVVPAALTLGMASRLRDCEQVLLRGVGHATALQAPELVAGHLIRFLTAP